MSKIWKRGDKLKIADLNRFEASLSNGDSNKIIVTCDLIPNQEDNEKIEIENISMDLDKIIENISQGQKIEIIGYTIHDDATVNVIFNLCEYISNQAAVFMSVSSVLNSLCLLAIYPDNQTEQFEIAFMESPLSD